MYVEFSSTMPALHTIWKLISLDPFCKIGENTSHFFKIPDTYITPMVILVTSFNSALAVVETLLNYFKTHLTVD